MLAVSHSEAVAILRRMVESPDKVRAVRSVDRGAWGPLPFFVSWQACEAEVTFAFSAGVVTEVASIRIGDRFTNAHEWGDNPLDDLREVEVDLLELVVGRRQMSGRIGSG